MNEPKLQTYLQLRAEGLTAREKMTAQQALVEKDKQQHKSDQAGVSSTKAEMEKIIGPMEQTLNVTLESVLEMKGNLWWGDFIGPDMSRFFSNSVKYTEGPKMRYALLVSILRDTVHTTDKFSEPVKKEGGDVLDQYLDMWSVFQQLYAKVKHAGQHLPQQKLEICRLTTEWHSCFVKVCFASEREPPPKCHIMHAHQCDFILNNDVSWALAEEAGESAHGLVNRAADSNVRQHGWKAKLEGTLRTFQHTNSLKFGNINTSVKKEGRRRAPKKRNILDL